jgi:hypothetical protein
MSAHSIHETVSIYQLPCVTNATVRQHVAIVVVVVVVVEVSIGPLEERPLLADLLLPLTSCVVICLLTLGELRRGGNVPSTTVKVSDLVQMANAVRLL